MLRTLAVIPVLIVLLSGPALAERPLIAVLDFGQAKTQLDHEDLGLLSDVARAQALASLGSSYDVITRENLETLLQAQGKSLERCLDGSCETDVGREIGAELIVSGRIVKAFGAYKVNLKLHRTDPPKLLGAEMLTVKRPADLEDALRSGTARLLSIVSGARPLAPAPAPVPAKARSTSRGSTAKRLLRAAGKSAKRHIEASALAAEAAASAVTELATQANTLKSEAQSLSRAWAELEGLANNEDLSKDQRVAALRLFLTRAPEGSGYEQKAAALLAKLTEGPAWYGTRTEFFSIGYAYGTTLQGGHGGFWGLPTLKWERLYWQTLEYVGLSLTGTYGAHDDGSYLNSLATIVGYRQRLTPDGRHDLRLGLGLSYLGFVDSADIWSETTSGSFYQGFVGLGLVPELGWVWHMNASTSLITKLRFILPYGDGYMESDCYINEAWANATSCPWENLPDDTYSPEPSVAFTLGLGW